MSCNFISCIFSVPYKHVGGSNCKTVWSLVNMCQSERFRNQYCTHYTRNSSGDETTSVNFFYDDIVNHFYALRPGSFRIRWNNAKITAITPFTVIQSHDHDFGTNRKLTYDFLLVISDNLPPSLHCFRIRQVENRYIWLPLMCLTSPPLDAGIPLGRSP